MDSGNYVVIQGWMCNELNLKGNDLLVFAYIYSFSRDGQSVCCSSVDTIAKTFNISKPTVIKAIQNLADNEYIIKNTPTNITKPNTYKHNEHVVKKLYHSGKKTLLQRSKETLPNNTNIFISKDINNNTDNNTNKYNTSKTEWFLDNYHAICVSFPQVRRLTDKRKNGILKIMSKYSKEDILEMFKKAEESDFLKGVNDTHWKADIDFMLREDKFVNILENKYGGKKQGRSAIQNIERMTGLTEKANRKGGTNGGTKF